MKINMKKFLALLLAGTLALSYATVSFAAPEDASAIAEGESAEGESAEDESAEGESADSEGDSAGESAEAPQPSVEGAEDVTVLMAGLNNVLVYWPENNIADESPLNYTCTAPVFLVFGEGAYDADSARAYAIESGLADIAASEGSSVVFVNPVEEAWSDADAETYSKLIDLISDSSTDPHAKGITESFNFFTGGTSQAITGTKGRIYVYGIGAGADYVAANILKDISGATTYPDGVTIVFNNTITAATVEGLSDASMVEESDIPVVSIGNSDEVNAALEAVCGEVLVEETEDFAGEFDTFVKYNRRQAGFLAPNYYWDEMGIVETIEAYEVTTSEDNVTFAGQPTHDINYVTYYGADLDVEEGNVPLVLCFHGGGNTALFEAQATTWPLIGLYEGFITVSVDLHYPNCSATELVDLIGHLEEEYSIDPSRIYASGFSMGGCQSWDLFDQYPTVFAGLAPMDASQLVGLDSFDNEVAAINEDTLMPVFYVAGEVSPLPEMPCQDQKLIDRIAHTFSVNGVVAEYNVTMDDMANWENPVWGINGDIVYDVTDTDIFTDSTLNVNLFASADGKYYTALALSGNQSHEVYARNSVAAWDFLSQFSRDEDGSIVIEDAAYIFPADDESVVDNSYNLQ